MMEAVEFIDYENIEWENDKSYLLINPKTPIQEKEFLLKAIQSLEQEVSGTLFFATSGTTGALKWVALTKKALLTSAEAVNQHLKVTSRDLWFNPLPNFHVGGVGILARSFLSQSKVFGQYSLKKWDAQFFAPELEALEITLTSLVPAQVFDLVSLKIAAPKKLRAAIVGGGRLSPWLYEEGRKLGWPLLPSYGLTECASQVATASLGSLNKQEFPTLRLLSHIKLKMEQGFIKIQSPSLLSFYLSFNNNKIELWDPKEQGWLVTEDLGVLDSEGSLKQVMRRKSFCKIGGENVDLNRIDEILQRIKFEMSLPFDVEINPLENKRLGHVLSLRIAGGQVEHKDVVEKLIEEYNSRVFPFEKIREICFVDKIRRTSLGKKIFC